MPNGTVWCLLLLGFLALFAPCDAFQGVVRQRSSRLCSARVSTITTRRPRRRDLKKVPPVEDDGGDDEDEGGGGGGKRWVRVWPVGMGQYGEHRACFLAKRREVGEKGAIFDSLPIPLFDTGALEMVTAAFQKRDQADVSRAVMQWAARHMAVGRGRETSAFDNLPWASWVDDDTVKVEAFMKYMGKGVTETLCPYGILNRIIEEDLGGSVTEVVIDEEDSPRGPGITFGPVLLISEKTIVNPNPRAAVVDCSLDEVVGMALALNRPIAMPEDLFLGTVVPTRCLGVRGGILQLEAEADKANMARVRDLLAKMDAVKPAWEIKTATEYWAMDAQTKRLCLIKSGCDNIPKRRYGTQELELALLPYLDETVRFEARLALAMEAGDEKLVEKLLASRSERSKLKDAITTAMREGNLQRAQDLEDRLELLTEAKQDVTMEDGTYQKDLDADEWYLSSRRS